MTGKADAVNFMVKYRTVLAIALVVAILGGSAANISFSTVSPSNVATYNKFTTVIPTSYLVFTDGTTTYGRNGNTGAIDYSGTNTATVINNVISAMSNGGKIFVKQGVYTLTSTVNLGNAIELIGETENVGNLVGASPNAGVVFNISGNIVGISASSVKAVRINDFLINGNKVNNTIVSSAHNISFVSCTMCYVEHVSSVNAKASGLYIQGNNGNVVWVKDVDMKTANEAGINAQSAADFQIDLCNCGSNVGYGIWVKDSSNAGISNSYVYTGGSTANNPGIYLQASNNMRVVNNRVNTNGYEGIEILASSSGVGLHNIVANNVIYNNGQTSSRAGIRISGSGAGIPSNNTIIGNSIFDDQGSKTQSRSIQEDGTANGNLIIGNDVDKCSITPCISTVGASTIVRNNKGFTTENSGSASVASGATTATVTHGLSYTPSINDIVITPQGNWGSCANWWVSSPTSTQFTINCSVAPGGSGLTFGWSIKRTF